MLSHEFFHEQVHLEKRHELKRRIVLFSICIFFLIFNSQLSTLNSQLISAFTLAILYRFFCHSQEFEADRVAAKKCGKNAAVESLKLLQMQEGKTGFLGNLFSLHPKTEKRIERIYEQFGTSHKAAYKSAASFF
ncbi:MAG: M48 family metalloprotease [Candidatus Fibromonas sp.]|jgi:Zn-dependent protease with chaperone function|nr:M48 family metalloprotease [Candidatus Fibromonas sp.]